jgi:N,N'-diacetylchitobiose phosphorylase
MKYGYFDDKNKEYVITNPNTPRSWSNYLGNTRFGSVISNNAGGYTFFKSAAQGRFTRLRFNAIPMDQPGRYVYVHDRDKKDFWSTSWQPVGKPLDKFSSECRHGSAYTRISSDYDKIKTDTLFFVPLDKDYECWNVKVTNTDTVARNLSLFTYVEYVGNWNAGDDLINLQYTQYTVKMDVVDDIIDHGTNVNIPAMPDNFQEKDQGRHTFLGIAGAKISGFDTDREAFLGSYRTYANPEVVESGTCKGTLASGDNGCGTMQVDLDLAPGETKEFTVVMGIGSAAEEGKEALTYIGKQGVVEEEFQKLVNYWHGRISGMTIETPDAGFNSMMNMWNPFNSLMTFTWSRAASLVYAGERDGLGYRDTVQDMLGVMPTIPDEAGERLELMITGQLSTGGAMPVVKQFAHEPGNEPYPPEEEIRSDDCMWLFNAVPAYIKETGNLDFYDKVLPFADKDEATVLGHLKRAIEFNLERTGMHGLPCGLKADWNDCLELGHQGESVFVAMQLRLALATYKEIAAMKGLGEEEKWGEGELNLLDEKIDKHSWDGDWYLRAFRHDGMKFGSSESEEGFIFMNPQSWSVFSGHATGEKAQKAMNSVEEHLATKYGIMVCAPPFEETDYKVIRATLMNPGMKENGGIFNHTQGWAIIAETLLGNGNRAWQYYKAFNPSSFNDKAELREIEPYVFSQSTHSKYSPRYGKSRVPWLSGTATWAYHTATNYILGIQPEYNGLTIDPCISEDWPGFTTTRVFRGMNLNVEVNNPNGIQKGIKKLSINGEAIEGNFIPLDKLSDGCKIVAVMG